MPNGKPAFVRCVQLDEGNRCRIFGHPERPRVCSTLQAQREMCGESNEEAFRILQTMELKTVPGSGQELLIKL